jgi:hypothetical protein
MIEPCASIHRRASHIRKIGNLNVLLVPNALAAPFAFEKANCLSLFGVEELMGELKDLGTRWAINKWIVSPRRLLIVVHAPPPIPR